jgi:UDP-perosamine 4-acetyltransferase
MVINRDLVVLGAGGHAKVCVSSLLEQNSNLELTGYIAPGPNPEFEEKFNLPYLGTDEEFVSGSSRNELLINGIAQTSEDPIREKIYNYYSNREFSFYGFKHPSSVYPTKGVHFDEGVQLMSSSTLQSGVTVNKNSIINTNASVDHDCLIGQHSHIGPGAILCGNVQVGSNVHVGAGATIVEGVEIAPSVIIGAGAVVIDDIEAGNTVVGTPAQAVQKDN